MAHTDWSNFTTYGTTLPDHYHQVKQTLVEASINPRLPNGTIIAVLMLIGIVGNVLVVYIYQFKLPQTVFSMFVTVLALLDLCNTFCSMPLDIAMKSAIIKDTNAFNIMCKIAHFTVYGTNMASGSVLLLIAATRYRKVCQPLQPSMTKNQAKFICVLCLIVAMSLSSITIIIKGIETIKIATDEVDIQELPVTRHPATGAVTRGTTEKSSTKKIFISSSENTVSEMLGLPGNTLSPTLRGNFANNALMDMNATNNLFVMQPVQTTQTSATGQRISITSGHWENPSTVPSPSAVKNSPSVQQPVPNSSVSINKDNYYSKEIIVVEISICRTSLEYQNTVLCNVLSFILAFAFITILLSIIILHFHISKSVARFQRDQSSMHQQSNLHRESINSETSNSVGSNTINMNANMFRIFASITVVFIVSYLPHLICLVVEPFLYQGGAPMPTYCRILLDLAYNSPYINVIANPFIYGYKSPTFRKQCFKMFCRCCRRRVI